MRGMIQYTWTKKIRWEEKREAAFNSYIESFVKSAYKQKKVFSACKNETIRVKSAYKTKEGIVLIWKCEACGREVPQLFSFKLLKQ